MATTNEKRSLKFHAGEVGFVFYEDSGGFPAALAGQVGRTYAFGTIGDAAAWLVGQFPETSENREQQPV